MSDLDVVLRKPEFLPLNAPLLVSAGTLSLLADQIVAHLVMGARGTDGKVAWISVNYAAARDIAREALQKACGATNVVEEGEPGAARDAQPMCTKGTA